ncbi:MAG: hypothetical protein MHPDNHAH_00850 [Anaerolineales bacterium]|nr:hypothetical protein [Anaerolineales bacterium]
MKPRFNVLSFMMLVALILSLTPAATAPTSVSAAQTCTDKAQFIADVTVPDGTRFEPGAPFTKDWRLRNVGTCTWTTSYSLVFDTGEKMGAVASSNFANNIAPGQIIDITINMTAPSAAGHYIGYWKFKNAQGALFGIGVNANKAWWVEINVVGTSTTNVAFDFIAKAGEATWSSGAGGLSFPGTNGDAKGFALKLDKPKFESGVELAKPGFLFAPQNITNGFIQGRFPPFRVESGDKFQTRVGCEFGATSCYTAYRLDYEVGNSIRTFWTFRERYEGLTYDANIDLSPLAGQEVRFILYVSAYGSPVGDRALWGNPVIVRKGSVPPPPTVTGTPPTSTPTKTPGPITPTVPPSACDRVQFVADVTVPDGSTFAPGATFTKTWRLKNVGSCTWTTSYQLAFFSGEQMSAPASATFPRDVAVGQTIDITVPMTAPAAAGSYRGYWMFKNASGALFGIGSQANKPWWVDIKVSGPTLTPSGPTKTPTPTATTGPTVTPQPGSVLDFATGACSATWTSGAGQLPCPGTDGDARGFALKLNSAKLENGSTDPRQTVLTFPQNVSSGYIQGSYPPFRVQAGDRFRSTIGCEYGSNLCYVAFRLDYQIGSDPVATFWGPFLERYEGQSFNVDIDLSPLAGKDVKFVLTALAVGPATGDRALWVGPHIYRATGGGGGSLPDLTINSLSISFPNESCFNPGETLGVRVRVTNSGQASAGSFAVQVGTAQQTVSGLAVGETKIVFFSGYTNPVSVVVDPGGVVAESNESNNSRNENLPVPTPPLPCLSPTPTSTSMSPSTPTLTATPDPLSGWNLFQNSKYKFGVKIPPDAAAGMSDNSGRADFPFAAGTNLREKYLAITVTEGLATCKYASGAATSSSNVTINSVQFLKEEGSEGAAGSFYDWLSYSTMQNNACINLAFVLKSVNPGNLPTPPPIFDKVAESAVFNQIINSFAITP